MIFREHKLQQAVKVFCARCVAVPHEFASHDRAAPRSDSDHIWQARRGIRRGWPDTELLLPGGRTFRVELKRPGVRIDEESQQAEMLTRLNELGHQAAWANSVTMYGRECERFGVPLRGNWPTIAQLYDEQVLAAIRKAEGKAPKPKKDAPALVKLRTVRRKRPTQSEVRRGGMTVRHLP